MHLKNDKKNFYILGGEHIIAFQAIKDTDISKIKYCIPLNYAEQIPLQFSINGEFVFYNIIDDNDEPNKVVEIVLPPIKKDEKIKIYIKYWVLIQKSRYNELPKKASFPTSSEIPNDIKKYLMSSNSIQSDDILIRLYSKILRGFSNNMVLFINKTMHWAAYHGAVFDFCQSHLMRYPVLRRIFVSETFWLKLQDALSCLIFGGQCIGKANMTAALLRAQGIPVRVLIISSIFYGEKLYVDSQHYAIEYFCPGFGWVRSQFGTPVLFPNRGIVMRIVPPKEENIAGGGFSFYGGAATWFWIENENIKFGKVEEFNFYKIPKKQKLGFPILRNWKEKVIQIPINLSEEIIDLSKETWELFTKKTGNLNTEKKQIFKNANNFQKQAVDYLKKQDYKNYIKFLKNAKELYERL